MGIQMGIQLVFNWYSTGRGVFNWAKYKRGPRAVSPAAVAPRPRVARRAVAVVDVALVALSVAPAPGDPRGVRSANRTNIT